MIWIPALRENDLYYAVSGSVIPAKAGIQSVYSDENELSSYITIFARY